MVSNSRQYGAFLCFWPELSPSALLPTAAVASSLHSQCYVLYIPLLSLFILPTSGISHLLSVWRAMTSIFPEVGQVHSLWMLPAREKLHPPQALRLRISKIPDSLQPCCQEAGSGLATSGSQHCRPQWWDRWALCSVWDQDGEESPRDSRLIKSQLRDYPACTALPLVKSGWDWSEWHQRESYSQMLS